MLQYLLKPAEVPTQAWSPRASSSMKEDNVELMMWMQKLVGKKIGTTHDATAKADLPHQHRIIVPGFMYTLDWEPDRLNIHTDSAGVVVTVKFG
ncbi:hypothetical protein AMS68_002654 [Peltaster fructicola]|uniref:Proteinase inhibitor I78 n=1 Tax=Peltaster fructicola TaxID=286661 RepID=A0A6H0XQV1_9PEZI|nr:hypothetical protein AMS68_002654 [Peltaster fructicola]